MIALRLLGQRALGLMTVVVSFGCASTPSGPTVKFDSKAAERAKPFLNQHYGVDIVEASSRGVCATPKADADWKMWVYAAGSCVQKQDWVAVENLGTAMAANHVDSPWGSYFLGVAAAQRGEQIRAEWMMDLAEKKAGGPLGLVQYERARWIEKDEGAAVAAVSMKEAVRRDPSLLPGFLWLAQVHHRDRMASEAEQYYLSALALNSDSWPALRGLAALAIDEKKGPEAVGYLTRAIQLKPDVAETRIQLASVYESLTKEPLKALQTLRELRVALEKGRARGRNTIGFDIGAKIRSIEETMKTEVSRQAKDREPAQMKNGAPGPAKKGG